LPDGARRRVRLSRPLSSQPPEIEEPPETTGSSSESVPEDLETLSREAEAWSREMADRFPGHPATTPWVAAPSPAERSTPWLLLGLLGGTLVLGLLGLIAFQFWPIFQADRSASGDVVATVTPSAHEAEIRSKRDEIHQLQRLLQEQSRRAEFAELRATMAESRAQVRSTTSVPVEPIVVGPVLPAPEAMPKPSERSLPQPALSLPPVALPSLPDATATPLTGGQATPDRGPGELSRSRVFVHYTAQGHAVAQELEQHLKESVAYLELRAVPGAPSIPVIRFFFPADRSAAEQLARRLGTNWRTQDFATASTKPRRGTLEVWLPNPDAAP
jgi:hypothetical protein